MDKMKYKEIIDGVTVVHNGKLVSSKSMQEGLDIYDENGNKFYSNFNSKEDAALIILKLAEEGIEAVIGPKAPWINCVTGEPMHNKDNNAVGVYIVKEEKKEKTK